MRTVFADSSFWIALLNPRDSLHSKAKALSGALVSWHIVTSEMVLTECLNDFAGRGTFLREAVITLVEGLRQLSSVSVVPQSSDQFEESFSLYSRRRDKAWSCTDCASFQVMERHGLQEALTHDGHFEQAGFQALLR